MTNTEITAVAANARTHANNLAADIPNASTRIEHMRLTRLAIEADAIALELETLAAHG